MTLFTRDEIDAMLRERGFDEMEHIGRDEARAKYFGGQHDVEIAGAQALVSTMVRSPSAVTQQTAERARIRRRGEGWSVLVATSASPPAAGIRR